MKKHIKSKLSAYLYSAISWHFTKTFLERFDKCDNVTWNRSQENVRQLYQRQFSEWTDLNLIDEGSSKVAVDGFEPAILRWQAGMHRQDHKPCHGIHATRPGMLFNDAQ